MATAAKKKLFTIVVSPATDNAHKEALLKINGKRIPFGIPIKVEERDIKTIERINEQKRSTNRSLNVHQIMEDMKISQEKANRVARLSEKENIGNSQISYVPKYFVKII